MIRIILLSTLFLTMLSCQQKEITVSVENDLDINRIGEMVEVSLDRIGDRLNRKDFIVTNTKGEEIPYQLTSDDKLIFQADVRPKSTATYTIRNGITSIKIDTICKGRVYHERMDDIAWENDLGGYRAYGPELERLGERGYGYDLFTKRGTKLPVLDTLYYWECHPILRPQVTALRKTDIAKAQELNKKITYHVDRGYGMDCYAVGPTLGAGVSALIDNGKIVYPWCYSKAHILDNGPLRFKVKLTFNPLTIKGKDNVVETRVITLDKGVHLNKTEISYTNINTNIPIVTGIVLHNEAENVLLDCKSGYMTYQDPTTKKDVNGKLFLGAAFPDKVDNMKVSLFTEEERKEHGNAFGHILAESIYNPKKNYIYYWGFGWDRLDVENLEEWNIYMREFAEKIRKPLKVRIH